MVALVVGLHLSPIMEVREEVREGWVRISLPRNRYSLLLCRSPTTGPGSPPPYPAVGYLVTPPPQKRLTVLTSLLRN